MSEEPPTTREDLVDIEVQRAAARRASLIDHEDRARQADLDSWRLCDEVTVSQAALLICNVSPSSSDGLYWRDRQPHERPMGLDAARTALTSAILAGRLKAKLRFAAWYLGFDNKRKDGEFLLQLASPREYDPAVYKDFPRNPSETASYAVSERPDWDDTTVVVDDLRQWLMSRGFSTGFFFAPAQARETPDYLDPTHERFAPKLAAAVLAWQAVTGAGKKSAKTALTKWLNENAARLGLVGKDGTPIKGAVLEAATVANWQAKGGAPKTKG
jgi:hypothetical protein